MSAPHQRLPWCRCIKDEFLTLFERKWFAMTSAVPSLLPACCCLLTTKPLLSLSVSAPLIFPVSPTHFSCLCHSLHHTRVLPPSFHCHFAFFFLPGVMMDCTKHSAMIILTLTKDEDSCLRHLRWINIALTKYALLVPHFFFLSCWYADLVSQSWHQHQTGHLFLVRCKIYSQKNWAHDAAVELFALH